MVLDARSRGIDICPTRLEPVGPALETYPAAALNRWGLPSRGYKKNKGRDSRVAIRDGIHARAPWLRTTPDHSQLLAARDDALDALVAALIARAAKMVFTIHPTEEERLQASTEGWIHVPVGGSLERLTLS
jgi:hypothetical protein